jgi:hypothetical protein
LHDCIFCPCDPSHRADDCAAQAAISHDLSSDPHEDNNLFMSDLTCGWILAPNFKLIAEYELSLKQYPNIKVGEDFTGCKK